jgi:hypothetical protein
MKITSAVNHGTIVVVYTTENPIHFDQRCWYNLIQDRINAGLPVFDVECRLGLNEDDQPIITFEE